MKFDKIDNAIEGANSERKEEMRAELRSRLDLSAVEEPSAKRGRFAKVSPFALGAVGICAVCCAIVLPIALKRPVTEEPPTSRYCLSADCWATDLGCTVKEYAENSGKNILYIDWYDNAEECVTKKFYYKGDENDIVYISEDIISGETGDHVHLTVTDRFTDVDMLDILESFCVQSFEYNNIEMSSSYSIADAIVCFEYDGYKYYIQLYEPTAESALIDIVKEIF